MVESARLKSIGSHVYFSCGAAYAVDKIMITILGKHCVVLHCGKLKY